jgi:hypothetical protein
MREPGPPGVPFFFQGVAEMWQLVFFFVSAHLAYEAASDGSSFAFAAAGVTTGALVFLYTVRPRVPAAIGFLVVSAALARVADVFGTFVVAYACTSLYTVWLHLARRMVRYEMCWEFCVTRACSYASLRAATRFLVESTPFPAKLGRLVPFAVACAETAGMAAVGFDSSYTFARDSHEFAVYTALKLTLFLSVPILEEALV